MKRLFLLLAAAAVFAACSPDAEGINETLPPQEEPEEKPEEPGNDPENPGEDPGEEPVDPEVAAARVEKLCEQLNGDLATLYTLIAADELPDCVVNVAPIAPAGETVGYSFAFKQNGSATLYFGPNATAAEYVPQFGVYEADGIRYWAMNGQPLPTATGAPAPVVNDEGIAPRLKAEKGYWHISVDDGKSWWPAGQAPDGTIELATMPLVSQITEEPDAWSIVLADGETTLSLLKEGKLFSLEIDTQEELLFQPDETHTVHYTVANGSSKTIVTAELENLDNTYDIKVVPADPLTGSITISTSTNNIPTVNKVLITATDGSRKATATIDIALWSGFSGKTITVGKPGMLAQLLVEFDKTILTELIVVGNLNSADIATLKSLPKLAILDMENVNLETLPVRAFYEKTSLISVKLPKSLKTIEKKAFCGCSGLTGELVIPQGVTSIGEGAFFNCSGLTGELVIPQGVTSIGISAFSGCRGLTSLTIPASITSISSYTFVGCNGLTGKLVIPQGVTTIGESAFGGCHGLTELVIPQGVTTIGECAFDSCNGLTSLTIPASVTSIGRNAFYYCSGMTTIYCKAIVPPKAESSTFYDTKVTLYVPVGTAEAYEAADGWKEFETIVEMEF